MDPKRSKSGAGQGRSSDAATAGTTGRYLVLMRQDSMASGIKALSEKAGLKNIASTADFSKGAIDGEQLNQADAVIFDQLAVALVDAPPEQIQSLNVQAQSAILAIEPERIVYAIQQHGLHGMDRPMQPPVPMPVTKTGNVGGANIPLEYLQGYRDAVNNIVGRVLGSAGAASAGVPAEIEEAVIAVWDESEFTWGLQATKASATRFTGKGIRVAVLDTGFDVQHPDFAGRRITAKSFISGEDAQDGHGHGTHCIGTACGPLHPQRLPRYGIAYESEIFAGKVLSNQGSGSDGGILAGINWAVSNGCHIVSMSLGASVSDGQAFSQIFEEIAQRALAAGTLIVAAAGNDSQRPASTRPVSHPANCPSIMAVAALEKQLEVAFFSNAGFHPLGGQVDIAAPGTEVISSWPRTQLYRSISGTSMATPHVAGIAALLAEASPGMTGRNLMSLVIQSARRLEAPARHVGAGLVQAP